MVINHTVPVFITGAVKLDWDVEGSPVNETACSTIYYSTKIDKILGLPTLSIHTYWYL